MGFVRTSSDKPRRAAPARSADDRGAAAVEFAILLPLLLLIVFGIVDFGYALYSQHTLTQAAREGARLEALGRDAADVDARTREAANGVAPERLSVSVPEECPGGEDAKVLVEYSYEYLTPVGGIASLIGGEGFGDAIAMSAEGVMPCEG